MNWGNRLVLVFLVFGAGMGYLVYRSMNTDYELVESDYYKQELRYQNVINEHKSANSLSAAVNIEKKEEGLLFQFPEEMKNKPLTGELYFYCAYDSKKDKRLPLQSDSNGVQTIPAGTILPGSYTVKIKWSNGEKSYYSEQNLSVL